MARTKNQPTPEQEAFTETRLENERMYAFAEKATLEELERALAEYPKFGRGLVGREQREYVILNAELVRRQVAAAEKERKANEFAEFGPKPSWSYVAQSHRGKKAKDTTDHVIAAEYGAQEAYASVAKEGRKWGCCGLIWLPPHKVAVLKFADHFFQTREAAVTHALYWMKHHLSQCPADHPCVRKILGTVAQTKPIATEVYHQALLF